MKRFAFLVLLLGISASALWAGLERSKVYVLAYLEEDFKGEAYRIPVPTEVPNSTQLVKVLGIPTDSIASLKVPDGVVVTLYDHSAYGGVSGRFTGNVPKLGKMKQLTSALKAAFIETAGEKTVSEARSQLFFTVYLGEDFVGRRFKVEVPVAAPDDAALRRLGIPNDSIESLDIPAGVRVTLYDHKGYGGRHASFEGKVPSVGIMKDLASSLKAELIEKP